MKVIHRNGSSDIDGFDAYLKVPSELNFPTSVSIYQTSLENPSSEGSSYYLYEEVSLGPIFFGKGSDASGAPEVGHVYFNDSFPFDCVFLCTPAEGNDQYGFMGVGVASGGSRVATFVALSSYATSVTSPNLFHGYAEANRGLPIKVLVTAFPLNDDADVYAFSDIEIS